MISPGAFSSSQFVVHLNEVSSSLGNLKKCLCASRSSKAKARHEKWASILNYFPKVNNKNKKISILSENLPTDWLKNISVPNTRWLSKSSYPPPSEWKTSHISSDSFLLNKQGLPLAYETLCSPLYSQRMTPNRKTFIQNTQKRYRSTYHESGEQVLYLEKLANEYVHNPDMQLRYLQAIVSEDPHYVIRRYESGRYATNDDVKEVYIKALMVTDQLSFYEAARYMSNPKNYTPSSDSSSSSQNQEVNSAKQFLNSSDAGTKSQPLHVVVKDGKTMTGWSVLGGILRVAVTIAVFVWLINNVQSKMLNISQKEILPDQSEKKYSFDDVRGVTEAKEELQEVVDFLKNPEKFEKLGAKLPCGVLLLGPPGTGKTLLARAIAGEADVPFFFVSGSEFDEMFVGVGAARVRKLFAAAKEHSPCIIFIDELDAIGGKRVSTDHQPYSRMTLNQLLVELDGFDQKEGIIVIGATNFPEALDKALTRPGRFDSKVHVTMPDVRERTDILQLYIDKAPCGDDVSAEVIARTTPGFSGADLSNLVNQAALRAASLQSHVLTKEHFEWARDKIWMGPERRSAVIEESNRTLVAFHESGHAIVALFTKDALPVHKATVIPRGSALGYVMQMPAKDELQWSRKQLLAKMDVCMGGRVAEEMIFGEDSITTGASSDMQQASGIARSMVTQYGMSDKVGTVLIDERKDHISPELQSLIESEIKRLIQESYERAKVLLNRYSKEHKRLAEGLLKYETLDSDEIEQVLKGIPLQTK